MSESDSDENFQQKQIIKMVLQKHVATTPTSILIESLVKNLCSLIEKDDQKVIKLYNKICETFFKMKLIDESYYMTEFEGVRRDYQHALYQLVSAARESDEPLQLQQIWPIESSHYYKQFEELEFIAGGGFGQVFKVRHKLDDSLYAVKKIFIRANGIKSVMEYLSEAKTFARLNHHNIVQYKAAWLELGVQSNKKALEMPESTYSDVSIEEKHIRESSEFTVQFGNSKSTHESGIEFKKSIGDTRNSLSNPEYSTKLISNSRHSISEGGKAICKFNKRDFVLAEHNWATLYIQMSLCHINLKQWLDNRNQTEKDLDPTLRLQSKDRRNTILEILCQILNGLEYIHLKEIVHHDVKPSNVFIQSDGGKLNVQLGDFGLACPRKSSHSLAFGTKLYAAPEQLMGKCDPKSDMYSLGIILLELSDSYLTDMERIQKITDLRRNRLPSYISAADAPLATIISQLSAMRPWARPSATDLLARLTVPTISPEMEQVQELQQRLKERELEIERLKAMLKEKGVEMD